MKLGVKPLKNYQNINSFEETSEWSIRLNEENVLYFRLIDLDQEGLRYLPLGTTPSVVVTFPAVNSANIVTKTATLVSANDLSLWMITLLDTEKVYSGNVNFALTEGGATRRCILLQGMVVESLSPGGC